MSAPTDPSLHPAPAPGRVRLAGRPRRALRAAHVVVSVGWLGLTAAMLTLALLAVADRGLATSAYTLAGHLGTRTVAGAAVASLVSGVVLSLVTPWGLTRHRWVVVKTVLTLAVIVSALALTNGWVEQAATAAGAGGSGWWVVAGSATHLLLLAVATVVSVDKPWGPTRRGRLSATTEPPPARRPRRSSRRSPAR